MAQSYLLKGDVNRPGRITVEKGMTLRRIVEELGGGMANGKAFKAMQIGGPSGGLVTAAQLASMSPVGTRRRKSATSRIPLSCSIRWISVGFHTLPQAVK